MSKWEMKTGHRELKSDSQVITKNAPKISGGDLVRSVAFAVLAD
jgi:hypothetical protein